MKIGSHDSSSSVGFVTDVTITNDVTFDFNSSKTEKEIIVITIDRSEGNFCCYIIIPSFHTLFLQAVDHEGGFIAGDTSFQIKRENGEKEKRLRIQLKGT